MSTELVTSPGRALAERLTVNQVEGMEGLDPKVMGGLFPRLRIQQAIRSQRDAGGMPGQWRLGDRYLKEPTFVILRTHSFRALRESPTGDPRGKDATTTCGSRDNREPLRSLEFPKHTNCVDCDYAQWKDGPNGKRIPPPCREGIAFFGLLLEEEGEVPCWLLNQGVGSFLAAKELIQSIRGIRGIRSMAQPVITLRSKEQTNNGVVYYDPIFAIGTALLPVERYIDAVRVATKDVWWEPMVRESAPPADDTTFDVQGGTIGLADDLPI